MTNRNKPPSGVLKPVLKVPGAVYRAHLGWLFGHRLLMLRHKGRVTGLVHDTPLEVMHYDRAADESYVMSGWGRQSAWFRNLEAGGALEVWTGRGRYVPQHRVVAAEEALGLMRSYVADNRMAAKFIGKWLGYDFAKVGEIERMVEELPMVAFRPKAGTGAN
ncbi:MAG: nitroreductase family deazaflavin-dependent oxidoreductase [Tepidiformaceae bacterium]